MAIGEKKTIKGESSSVIFEADTVAASGRKLRLVIYRTDANSIYIFCVNGFIQTYNLNKTIVIGDMHDYLVECL